MIIPGKPILLFVNLLSQGEPYEGHVIFNDTLPNSQMTSSALSQTHEENPKGSSFRLPKYLQAILTLFICGILIASFLCLISRIKFWCRQKFRDSKRPLLSSTTSYRGKVSPRLSSVRVVIHEPQGPPSPLPNGGRLDESSVEQSSKPGEALSDAEILAIAQSAHETHSALPSREPSPVVEIRPRSRSEIDQPAALKPRVQYVRRVSGPFNEEALEFANDTYSSAGKRGRNYSLRASRKFHQDRTPKQKEDYHK